MLGYTSHQVIKRRNKMAVGQTSNDKTEETKGDANTTTNSAGSDRTKGKVGPAQGVPTNTQSVPIQVVSRDELAKPEYELKNGKLEIERGHPNYIFDNQRNQQAQENTVEVAAGTRSEDGTLKPNHPQADDANPSIVSDEQEGTAEERRNEANLKN
jgi:hypothetical protein